jgi:hypothetical protein
MTWWEHSEKEVTEWGLWGRRAAPLWSVTAFMSGEMWATFKR